MAYKVTETELCDVLLMDIPLHGDARGHFFESFNARDFAAATGVETIFVQDNQSFSKQGVLRGLHYQAPHPQGKLIRTLCGTVWDVAIDLRRSSPTFGAWQGFTLSAEKPQLLWIPPGFAHGFCVLSGEAGFLYKVTDYYHPEAERSICWNDPELNIKWPVETPVLSAKDAAALPLHQAECFA